VVAVSARVNKEQRDAVLKAGFCEVLLKPITPADILASVRRHAPISDGN
jgi:CheY-like chemotaxis protein